MRRLAVIIVHYKVQDDTFSCLDSFVNRKYSTKLFPIVVANQASDSFSKRIKERFSDITILTNKVNLGVAKGNNLGIVEGLKKKCHYFLLVNNDTILSPELIDRLVLFAEKEPHVGIVSPKIYFTPTFEYYGERYKKEERGKVIWYAGGIIDWNNIYATHRGVDRVDKGQFDDVNNTDFATGCCMLIKMEVIKKIGLLDENYFLYWEDVDYCIRARKKNFRIIYYPHAYLWHSNAMSSEKPGSDIHVYFQTRNRLYFGLKYASLRAKKSLIIDSLRLFLQGGVGRRAVVDFYTGKMGRGSI